LYIAVAGHSYNESLAYLNKSRKAINQNYRLKTRD